MGEALLVIVAVPVKLPVDEGVNVPFKTALCPAAILCPADIPLAINPAPKTLTFEMVTFELPEFVIVADRVLLLPVLTVPKFKLNGLAASVMDAAFTVRVALLLVMLPIELLTMTLNSTPLSAVVAEMLYVAKVAPAIAVPLLLHA